MRALKSGLVAAVLVVASGTAVASILGMQQLKLDFKKPDVARQATWTKSAKLVLGPTGLVHQGPRPESLDFALTTEPFAVGVSWRPATAVAIRATLAPIATTFSLANGQNYTPSIGRMYARYSPDAKHWSSWHVLHGTTEAGAYKFSGELAVPQRTRTRYAELVSKYARLDVPWKSDEEAAVNWILKSRPRFFANQQPFVGYVQFLYETNLSGGQRIETVAFDISYGLSGVHHPPKDPKAAEHREGPWRFRAR